MLSSPVMEPAVHVKGQEPLTPSMLAAAPLLEQKQLLGTFLILFILKKTLQRTRVVNKL